MRSLQRFVFENANLYNKHRNNIQFSLAFLSTSVKSEQMVNKYTNPVDKRFIKRYNAKHIEFLFLEVVQNE